MPFAVVLLVLTCSAANAETITGRASVIDANTLQVNGERITAVGRPLEKLIKTRTARATPIRTARARTRVERIKGIKRRAPLKGPSPGSDPRATARPVNSLACKVRQNLWNNFRGPRVVRMFQHSQRPAVPEPERSVVAAWGVAASRALFWLRPSLMARTGATVHPMTLVNWVARLSGL